MERAKQDEGLPSLIDALQPETERDLLDIQIADVLHVPAPVVNTLPLHWIGSTLTLLDARALVSESRAKKGGGGNDDDA